MKLYADIKLIEKNKKDFEKYNDKQFKKIYSNFNLQDSCDFWFDQSFAKRIKNKGKINFEKITYYLNNLPTSFTNINKTENKKIIKSQEKESDLKEKFDIPKNLKYVTYKSNINKSNQIYKNNNKEKLKINSKNDNNKKNNNNNNIKHNNILFNEKNLLINQTNKKLLFSKRNSNNNSILLFPDNAIKKSNTNIIKNIPLNYYYEINNNKKIKYKTSNSQTHIISSKKKKNKKRKNSNSITIKLTKIFEKNLTKTRNPSISKTEINPLFTPSLNQNSLKIVEKVKSNNETISKNKRISQTFNEYFYDKSNKIKNIKQLSQRLNETKLNNKKEKENENEIETSFNKNNESIKKENKKKLKRNYSTPIFEQQMEWKARVNLKIKKEQLKSELNEIKKCPFYPKISQIKDLNNTNPNYSESNNIYIKRRRERIKIKNNLEDEEKNKRTKPLLLSLRGYEKNKGWVYPINDLNKSFIYQKIRAKSVKIKGNNQNSFEKIVKAIFSN